VVRDAKRLDKVKKKIEKKKTQPASRNGALPDGKYRRVKGNWDMGKCEIGCRLILRG